MIVGSIALLPCMSDIMGVQFGFSGRPFFDYKIKESLVSFLQCSDSPNIDNLSRKEGSPCIKL